MGSRLKNKMEEVNSHIEIPVWLRGTQRWVNGLTKRTTCDDVIYAILYSEDRHEVESTDKYTIYERWRDVERPLQGRTKILKIWRAWGAEQCNVQLTMKHNDEEDEFGEFLHARHRQKRVRHHKTTRDGRDRHSKRKGKIDDQSTDRLKSIENLAKLVINQERQLHNIIHRIENTDRKINQHENRLHCTRVEENGEDYVQNAYLKGVPGDSSHEDSMDEFLRKVNPENWEMYLQFCDKMINMEEKLNAENTKIENLSHEIQEHSLNEAFLSKYVSSYDNLVSDESNMEGELFQLQADLNRIVSANMMQKYQAAEISKEIDTYDRMLKEKQQTINALQRELEYMEACEQELNDLNNRDDIVLTISHRKPNSGSYSSDLHSDYVNIDAILGWKESTSTSGNDANCAPEVVYDSARTFSQPKRNASDIDDSFSTDTDLTSNDSQFGNSKVDKPNHSTPISDQIYQKSLDTDDIISERIKSEVYTYKKGRGCHINNSANCSTVDMNRTFYCNIKHDDDSDTGLSSMHSDEASSSSYLETLV